METTELNGLVELTNEQYHNGPGISKSQLDAIAPETGGSPLNYWDSYINPDREPREYKHCFAVGDGTHKLVLEPGTFEQTYAVGFDKSAFPDALDTVADLKKELAAQNYMVSGSKPELAERLVNEIGFPRERVMYFLEQDHAATMQGRILIPASDYKGMLGMLQSISRDRWAAGLLTDAFVEQSFFATDPQGVLRKCRPDAITPNGEVVLDLKTTDDVSEDGFGKTIAQRRYHVQAAWYLDILYMLYGEDAPRNFAFIAVQKKRPYDVGVHFLSPEDIERGRQLYQRDLAVLRQCQESGVWPGRTGGKLVRARLPAWEFTRPVIMPEEVL